MSDVSRDEFDALVGRVAQLERRHDAAMELIGAELFGLRGYIDEQVAGLRTDIGERFDTVYSMIGSEAERADERHDAVTGMLTRILDRLGPEK
jgi:hypothetical protein